MFGFRVKTEPNMKAVENAADKAAYKNFGHAGGSIRKQAIASVDRSATAGPAGGPVHTRRGLARRALRYAADKFGVVIGFSADIIGQAMEPHEHGTRRGRARYPQRPTMRLALQANLGRVADTWKNSIS